jgi:predicted ribosomally synthesized peptide with SipW-like signal peptide
MNSDRTQRILDRVAIWRRPTSLLILLVPALAVAFAITTRLADAPFGPSLWSALEAAYTKLFAQPAASAPVVASAQTSRRAQVLRGLRPTPRSTFGAIGILTIGILAAAGFAAGTYAFLNSQATTPVATITSGNLAITVQYGSTTAGSTTAIPTAAWTAMLPGDVVGQQFTITSTGSAGSNVTARLSAVSAWDIRIAAGACPTTQLTGAPLTTTAVFAGALGGGGTSPVCVQATLPAGAAAGVQGTSAAFSIVLDATQVPS